MRERYSVRRVSTCTDAPEARGLLDLARVKVNLYETAIDIPAVATCARKEWADGYSRTLLVLPPLTLDTALQATHQPAL